MRHYVGMGEDLDDRLRAATTSVDMDKLLDLGCALADSDRLPDAEVCFRRASDLGSPAAAFNLGNSLAAQECWLEAVAAFELALERGENDAWLNLGLVLHELGDLAGEIRAYEQAEDAGDSGGPLGLASLCGNREIERRRWPQPNGQPPPATRPLLRLSPAGSGASPKTRASRPLCAPALTISQLPEPTSGTCS
jgi:tetratricopeptide (TPR) repeat protein